MSDHRPDHDRLTAYLDGALSIDATQWLERHLGSCTVCRQALERERRMLGRLDDLAGNKPPADFVEAVMARVAQYPAYRPAPGFPWQRVALWGGTVAALLVVLLSLGAWLAVRNDALTRVEVGEAVKGAVMTGARFGTALMTWLEEGLAPAVALFDAVTTILVQLFSIIREGGWILQLGLLLITVTLNYVFTRMVLNYQRRR